MEKIRVLSLGGSHAQIPLIQECKDRGYYTIVCDYLPDNPGRKIADEYHNVSTTDMDAVLNLAKKLEIDLVVAYASDPAAPTAAYVSEKLGLPGNSYESVRTLGEKDLFRELMHRMKLNTPWTVSLSSINEIDKLKDKAFPYIIKPTDSSGSRGVTRIDNEKQIEEAIEYALKYSRKKQVIVEEFIDNEIADIHGDGFVVKGELKFCFLGDHIYNKDTNLFNPTGTLWPTSQPKEIVDKITKDTEKLIKESGFKNGLVNIEARINSKGESYIMEIGPRSGGHFVPQAIQYATNFNLVKALLDVSLGKDVQIPDISNFKYSAYYAIHSDITGILEELQLKEDIKKYVKEFHQYVHPGEKVELFTGANKALGILLVVFDSRNEMEKYIYNMENYIELRISIK